VSAWFGKMPKCLVAIGKHHTLWVLSPALSSGSCFAGFLHLVEETTQNHSFDHFLFALAVGLCTYNFRGITLDPKTSPKPASEELRSVSLELLLSHSTLFDLQIIEELASEGLFSVWLGSHCTPNIVAYASSASPEV